MRKTITKKNLLSHYFQSIYYDYFADFLENFRMIIFDQIILNLLTIRVT